MVQKYSIEQLNHGRKVIDFMYHNTLIFIVSSLLLLSSIIIITLKGFNWGLDFTGGTLIEVNLKKPINLDILRENLVKSGIKDILVQNFDNNRDVILRITPTKNHSTNDLKNKVISVFNKITQQHTTIKRIEFIGPSVGKDLLQNGIIGLLLALIAIFIYIGLRFEWHLALSIVFALLHDIIVCCGILSLIHIEIDLTIIASLMSVLGYSLNDKIVVSDRIRENFRKINFGSSREITNVSLTQVLNRTLITSITTLAMILILLIFGGELLKGFSSTMLIGLIIGTVSSIYISSALALKLGMKRKHMIVPNVEKEGSDYSSTLL